MGESDLGHRVLCWTGGANPTMAFRLLYRSKCLRTSSVTVSLNVFCTSLKQLNAYPSQDCWNACSSPSFAA